MGNLRAIAQLLIAASLAILAGCAPLQENLNKAVLIEYDQVNNFRDYQFQMPIDFGGAAEETGISGNTPDSKGFWVTYLICSVRNEGSQAQAFPYDVSKFFVVYDNKEQFYKKLDPYTYVGLPHLVSGNPGVTHVVNEKFRLETQLGNDTTGFQPGYYPNVGFRISIFVIKTSSGPTDLTNRLALRYKDYPNVTDPRNQPPVVQAPNVTKKTDLLTACRPKL